MTSEPVEAVLNFLPHGTDESTGYPSRTDTGYGREWPLAQCEALAYTWGVPVGPGLCSCYVPDEKHAEPYTRL